MKMFKGRHVCGGVGRKTAKTWNSRIKKPAPKKGQEQRQDQVEVVPPPAPPMYIED